MFELEADKTQLFVRAKEPVTSGSVNVYRVRFTFSADWDGLERTAVFKAGSLSRSVPLDDSGECVIPREVLAEPRRYLTAGVCGKQGEDLVLPTVWADLGMILTGASPGEDASLTLPELWARELAGKGDALEYDGRNLSLMSGDRALSTVQISGGGGGGGTTDHRDLTHRDAVGQHPMESIIGLSQRLDKTLTVGDCLTVSEILKIMEV